MTSARGSWYIWCIVLLQFSFFVVRSLHPPPLPSRSGNFSLSRVQSRITNVRFARVGELLDYNFLLFSISILAFSFLLCISSPLMQFYRLHAKISSAFIHEYKISAGFSVISLLEVISRLIGTCLTRVSTNNFCSIGLLVSVNLVI